MFPSCRAATNNVLCSFMWRSCGSTSGKQTKLNVCVDVLTCKLKTLTTLFLIKEAHFNCLRFPTITSVFKVKVANEILSGCKRNRKRTRLVFSFAGLKIVWIRVWMNKSWWHKQPMLETNRCVWFSVQTAVEFSQYLTSIRKIISLCRAEEVKLCAYYFVFAPFLFFSSFLLTWWHFLALNLHLEARTTQGKCSFLIFHPVTLCHKLREEERNSSL